MVLCLEEDSKGEVEDDDTTTGCSICHVDSGDGSAGGGTGAGVSSATAVLVVETSLPTAFGNCDTVVVDGTSVGSSSSASLTGGVLRLASMLDSTSIVAAPSAGFIVGLVAFGACMLVLLFVDVAVAVASWWLLVLSVWGLIVVVVVVLLVVSVVVVVGGGLATT